MRFAELRTVEPWFWEVVAQAARNPEALRQVLWDMSRADLERFDRQFEWARAELSGHDFRAVHGCTRDEMQELAAWIASQGREYYARVYDNPGEVPRFEDADAGSNLDGVVGDVYVERFGTDMPYTG